MNDVQHRKYHATPFKNGARRARNAFGNPWDAEEKVLFFITLSYSIFHQKCCCHASVSMHKLASAKANRIDLIRPSPPTKVLTDQ
jgi:hypothetical protein